MRVLRDMNLSKLVDEDEPLFLRLLDDLFPGLILSSSDYPLLKGAIQADCDAKNLINWPNWNLKVGRDFVRHQTDAYSERRVN